MQVITKLEREAASGTQVLSPLIAKLSDAHLERLLKYCSSWNTHSKNCAIAQRVLNCNLAQHTPDRLAGLYSKFKIFKNVTHVSAILGIEISNGNKYQVLEHVFKKVFLEAPSGK